MEEEGNIPGEVILRVIRVLVPENGAGPHFEGSLQDMEICNEEFME